jgi:hypothetical protein
MAHSGPPGKGIKHGRTPVTTDWTDVVDKPYTGKSPDLPKLPRNGKWAPVVEDWWSKVRRMPHCALWTDTDWLFGLETAFMKAAFWKDMSAGELKSTMATEIRRREDQMGTTREALRKLRIRYVKPGDVDERSEAGTELEPYDETAAARAQQEDELAARRSRVSAG